MKAKFSSKAKRKMERDAERGVWVGLVELPLIPAFAAWLSCRHGYLLQSPDTGEALVAYRDGKNDSCTIRRQAHTMQQGRNGAMACVRVLLSR